MLDATEQENAHNVMEKDTTRQQDTTAICAKTAHAMSATELANANPAMALAAQTIPTAIRAQVQASASFAMEMDTKSVLYATEQEDLQTSNAVPAKVKGARSVYCAMAQGIALNAVVQAEKNNPLHKYSSLTNTSKK